MNQFFGRLERHRDIGTFHVVEGTFGLDFRLPAHTHADAYFTLVVRGAYRERYGSRERVCAEGTVIAHPARETHSQTFTSSSALLIRLTVRDCEREEGLEAALAEPRAVRSESVAQAAFAIHRELSDDDPASGMILEGLAFDVASRALRMSAARGGSRRRALSAQMCLHASISRPLSLTALAHELDVSRTTLYRDFNDTFGVAPGEYLRRIRIEAAASLLRSSPQSISEIAALCGYYDQSHLDRSFGRAMGVAPSMYREMLQPS